MKFETTYKLENFILSTKYEDIPDVVKERLKGCFIDLMGALLAGSKSEQFAVGLKLAEKLYGSGEIAVVGSNKKFNFMGASTAMGHSSNAYDIDDGHNLTRAHPGTSFIGAVLAAAYEKDLDLKEFLTVLLVSYETTIRSGAAIMDYYNFAHSSGTFGAVGVAAGVGRIYGFSKEQLNNVLSVAEFNAPLVPGIRSVEYPSMNKDGVPFGVMVGALAVMDTLCGFTGNKNLLEAENFEHYLNGLGKEFEVMNLYFKPYPCCRWAHPAIDACLSLINGNGIDYNDIKKIIIKTFKRATLLSKIIPKEADEAQYNIAYPVASAVVNNGFSIAQISEDAFKDTKVHSMMNKLYFEVDEELDSLFPSKRICKAEIYTNDGKVYVSNRCEPRGEANENIGIEWLSNKFYKTTESVISKETAERIVELIIGDESIKIREIVDLSNQ